MAAVRFQTSVLFFLLLTAPRVLAQEWDRGPLILELPASTQALALGNAFHLSSRDPEAIFYHPGRLGQVRGFMASFQRFQENGTLLGLSAGTEWFGGGVAVGLRQLSYETHSSLEEWSGAFSSLGWARYRFPLDEGRLREEGSVAVSETVFSLGYGKALMGLQAGVVGKLVEKRRGPTKAGTAAVDLGLATTAGPVTFGLSVQDLGADMHLGGEDIPLPTRFILGASTERAQVGPLDVSGTTALTYRPDGDLDPSLGVEVAYWPVAGRTFIGRIGYRHRSVKFTAEPLTFGGAFYGDDIILEYTYLGFEEGEPAHRFGIGWR